VHITTSSNLRFSLLQEHYFQAGNYTPAPVQAFKSIDRLKWCPTIEWCPQIYFCSLNFLMVQNHRNFIQNFASLVNISKDVSLWYLLYPLMFWPWTHANSWSSVSAFTNVTDCTSLKPL
jgi:hypothetical protein